MKFEGNIQAFEEEGLEVVRESLERADSSGMSPFRALVGVELAGEHPDTQLAVTYSWKATREERMESFPIWGPYSVFRVSEETGVWTAEGERNIWIWFIEPGD